MTVKTNLLKPERLQSHEVDFGTSIAQSIWNKVADYQNWTNSNIPIGYLLFFHGSQTYPNGTLIPKPNPNLWHLCNGSIINDPDSPLNGVTPPDLRKVYLKGGSVIGNTGGQTTINLSHNHSTTLVSTNDKGNINGSSGGDYKGGTAHTHTINTQWSPTENIIPPTREIQIYLRKK